MGTNTKTITTDMKMKLSDILLTISWREFSRTYFGKSCSWFYHKMDGINGTGGVGGFTPDECNQLKEALLNVSERIRQAAEKI